MADEQITAPTTPESVTPPATGETPTPPADETPAPSMLTQDPAGGETPPADEVPANADDADASGDDSGDGEDGAPETYEQFSVPEGMEIDEQALSEAQVMFKDMNLPQAQAQQFVDFYAKTIQHHTQKAAQEWAGTTKSWTEAVKADPEIGGDKLQGNMGNVAAMLRQPSLFSNEAIEVVNMHGSISHPSIVKGLVKVANLMESNGLLNRDDTVINGGATTEEKTRAQNLFPNMN